MFGNLEQAIRTLLTTALPGLFAGNQAASLTVTGGQFDLDVQSTESPITDPRPDDRVDNFPFDPANPPASFTLTQSPYPGPKRVYLMTTLGDRIALQAGEVIWDVTEPRLFTLNLRPTHDLGNVNGIQVLYGLTAVFITLKVSHTFILTIQSNDAAQLKQTEALVLGVMELNRQALIDGASATYENGEYSAMVRVMSFKFIQGTSPTDKQRMLNFQAEVELKVRRALAEGEGEPIVHIRTPGRPLDPNRSVDIHIDVEA